MDIDVSINPQDLILVHLDKGVWFTTFVLDERDAMELISRLEARVWELAARRQRERGTDEEAA